MSSRMKMESALDFLASKLKLESLKLNDKNECYLTFDKEFHVRCAFNEQKDEVILTSEVGFVQQGALESYKKIMSENFFWVGTAGATLFLQDTTSGDLLILSEHVPMAMLDEERFYARMEDFVNAIEYWHGEYPKLSTADSSSSSSTSGPDHGPEQFVGMGA